MTKSKTRKFRVVVDGVVVYSYHKISNAYTMMSCMAALGKNPVLVVAGW